MKKSKNTDECYKNEENGITLIALVVTIVVLLVLAGVTISTLTGENGIIANAKKARENAVIAEEEEKIKLAYSSALISSENGKVSSAGLRKEMKKNQDDVTVTVARNKNKEHGIKVIFEKNGHNYFVDGNGNITKDDFFTKDQTAVYWIVYSNNSDDSDLELVFNSTDNVDSNRKLIEKGENISKTIFETINDVPYYKYAEKIKQATIEDEIAPLLTTDYWFANLTNLTQINNIENIETCNVTDMYKMFFGCQSLTSLDLNNFDTSNVTEMGAMFMDCQSLTHLDLSNFDMSNVKYMSYMFCDCNNLTSLDLNDWETGNSVTMSFLFAATDDKTMNLKEIKGIENFDTSNIRSMKWTFCNCVNLKGLDLNSWDTSNVTSMQGMFYRCNNLTDLDVSNFNTSNVTDMQGMFDSCNNLTDLDVSSFDTSKVTNMKAMFQFCEKLTSLDLSSWNTSNVIDMSGMFNYCHSLNGQITIKGNVTSYNYMFNNTATQPNCTFTVNYTSSTSNIADNMINTKSSNSNVVKGEQV